MNSKYKPTLKLIGLPNNAFSILERAKRVAKIHKMDWEAIDKDAKSGDYDHLLAVLMKYFEVE